MKGILLQTGNLRTVICETDDSDGVGITQGRDYVELSWNDSIKIRDWLQLAIAEHSERASQGEGSAP